MNALHPKKLAALAALLALAAALFAALPSASAQSACPAGANVSLSNTNTQCTVTVSGSISAVNSSQTSVVTVAYSGSTATLTAVGNGTSSVRFTATDARGGANNFTLTVTVTGFSASPPGGGGSPGGGASTTPTAPAAGLTINLPSDSDDIVPAGFDYSIELVLNVPALATAAARQYVPTYIRMSGGLLGGCEGGIPTDTAGCGRYLLPLASGENSGRVTNPRPTTGVPSGGLSFPIVRIPLGTPKGEYTISVRMIRTNGSGTTHGTGQHATDTTVYAATKTFTVSDREGVGRNVGSATLSLARTVRSTAAGHVDGMRHARSTDANSMPETAIAEAGKSIFLNAVIRNTLGNLANGGAQITGFTISAPGGVVQVHNSSGAVITGLSANSSLTLPRTVGSTRTTPMPSTNFTVKRTTPGTVDVSVTAIGPTGVARTETITLTFTGPPSKLSLTARESAILNHYKDRDTDGTGTDTDTDARDDLSLVLAATDKAGNAVAPGTSGARTITDPDGNPVEASKLISATAVSGGATVVSVQVASGVSAASPLKSGEYTITVANSSTVKASAKFTVVSLANTVALEADEQMPSKIGQVVTVTATVTDSDGGNVADGTMVSFAAAGARAGVPVATRIGSTGNVATRNGKAAAKFVIATSGAGVITAVADSASNTLVLTSTAGQAPRAEAQEEVRGSAGLASVRMNSFTTWIASNDTTAAELFQSLAARGASSIQLWNGDTWLRYSIIDGVVVPGSVDFTITPGDVIYIGG